MATCGDLYGRVLLVAFLASLSLMHLCILIGMRDG